LEGAIVRRGSFQLGPVDLELAWADRVAITGPNGAGKSTLLAALLGRLPLAAGRQWLGPGVAIGELDQRRARLDAGRDLLSGFAAATGLLPEAARSTLAKLGLGADHVDRRPLALSPGEKTRASGTNCLVLDEPTNHLDLPAIEQLEEALDAYQGTVLVVTHDRWLLETLTVNRTWAVDAGRVVEESV
jgi:ATPase subunit of ABC transporter with duplicated ATPase domains